MYYSIDFGDFDANNNFVSQANTWEDWHLIPSSRPTIAHPEITTDYQEVTGWNGTQDLTEYVPGGVIWGDRTGSIEFYVANDYEDWKVIRRKIISVIHGKRLKMRLEEQPEYYYEGLFRFNDWKSEAQFSKVVIEYTLQPYKRRISNKTIVENDL